MKALSVPVVHRAGAALRRWLKDAWLARVSIVDWLRGLFGPRSGLSAWEASGKARPGVRPALEILESRETPDDVFGLLGTPLLGTGLALLGGPLLTPAAVMVRGLGGRDSLPRPRPTPLLRTNRGRPARRRTRRPRRGASAAGGDPAPSRPSPAAASPSASFDASPTRPAPSAAADDPFADPLGGDWLDAVGAALGSRKPPDALRQPGRRRRSRRGRLARRPPRRTRPAPTDASSSGPAATAAPAFGGSASAATPSLTPVAAPAHAAPATLAAASTPAAGAAGDAAPAPSTAAFLQAYGRTQLAFEPNMGQTDPSVNFLSHGPGFETFLTNGGAVLELAQPAAQAQPGQAPVPSTAAPDVLTLSFAGGDTAPQMYATDQLPSVSNYFTGDDPSKWIADVPNYAGVIEKNVYPGIDVEFHGDSQKELEYDFIVSPGADLSRVKVSWQGAQSVQSDGQGNLLITTASGRTLTETAPKLYQTINGVQQAVSGQGVVNADGTVSFQASGYDPTRPLVVDPSIVYSSYLGGSGADYAYAVAVDSSGAAYVTGSTTSTNFPTGSALQGSYAGGTDVFVTKLNAQGSGIVYSTYLGGSNTDVGYGVAVGLSGQVWVVGSTTSVGSATTLFPTTSNAYQKTATYGAAFAACLGAAGDALTYSTLLGNSLGMAATAVAVDAAGAAYLTGYVDVASGSTFPTTSGAFQTAPGSPSGGYDAFVAKLPAGGSGSLDYSSYLGGSSSDRGYGIAVDPSGDAYVTGWTQSTNFPTTSGAFRTTMPSGTQASFVAKVNPSGSALSYSTYLSGGTADAGYAVAVDQAGAAYVTGATSSAFPTTSGAFQTSMGTSVGYDAFVAELNPAGSGLKYGSYLGGGGETGTGIALDASGQATVVGYTTGSAFPVTANAMQSSSGGGTDAWVAQVNAAGTTLNYASYLGGSGTDEATGVGVDAQGFAYAVGFTNSSNFPTSSGAFQTAGHGTSNYDAFVTKIAQVPAPPAFTGINPDTGSYNNDRVTDTGNVSIFGTAAANATVTLSREGVGVIDTVTASASGLWTSTYYASAHTLPEGTAAFTATETVGGMTSAASADWLVTVDLTPPAVTLTAPATTAAVQPMLTVTASDLNGLAVPATVTILVYNSTGTTLLYSNASAATLTDGQASFRLAYTLTPGTTYQIKALVNDAAGNTGTSAAQTVQVTAAASWSLGATQALTSDALLGDSLDQLGNVHLEHALDLGQSSDLALLQADASESADAAELDVSLSPLPSPTTPAALDYNSDSVSQRPVVQATIASANNAALPSAITAVLTWNGTAATFTYSTAGDQPGDALTVAAHAPAAVTTTGRYPWKLEVIVPGQLDQTVTGATFVVAEDASPFGAGWTFGLTDQLVSIPYDSVNNLPAGMLRVFGAGQWSFYQGTSTFSSPADDPGTLTLSGGTYTYTAPDGTSETFNSAGYETRWTSADGQETLQFAYNTTASATYLTAMTAIDGGVSSFSYSSGLLSTIQTVNGRTYTAAYDGSNDLTQVTNPDHGAHTFSYDTTSLHRVLTEAFANLSNSWSYGAGGGLATDTWGGTGSPGVSTLLPVVAQGLTTPVVGPVLAAQTDPTGHAGQVQLDGVGRPLKQFAADGGPTQWARAASGWVTAETDALGRTTTYALDSDGYVTRQTNPDGSTLGYQYQTAFHALVSMTDARGETTTYAYDPQGHLTSTTDALGDVTAYGYNSAGLETSVTDALGHTTTSAYDADRRLTAVTDALNHTTTYAYDANGNLQTTTDALGRVTTSNYDVMGRATQTVDAAGNQATNTYNAAGLELSSTDALGRVAQPTYDSYGRGLVPTQQQAVGTPVQANTVQNFDAAGRVTATRDADGDWSFDAYDALGRATATTDALGAQTLSRYDAAGQLTATRDALGNWTQYAYNAMGEQTGVTDALGHVTTTAYDAAGDATAVTDPLGHTTTTAYDALGRVTAVTDPLGHTVTTTFDAAGDVSTVTDADGNVTSYAYDALNRMTMTTVAVGTAAQASSTVAYDAAGNQTSSTDALGHTTATAYDQLGEATAVTDALGHTTTTAYDALGDATAVTDALNQTTTYLYDQLNRQVAVTDALGHTTTSVIDVAGDTRAAIDPLGDVTQTLYDSDHQVVGTLDALGHLTQTRYNAAGEVASVIDADGNQTQYLYDALGRQTVTIDPLGNRTTTAYDAAGDATTVTDPLGHATAYQYDAAGRETATTDALGHTVTTTFDAVGNVSTVTDADGNVTSYAYDAQNRETATTVAVGTAAQASSTVAYDAAGDATSATDPLGHATAYQYDALERQTAVTDPLGHTTTTAYDAVGDVTAVTDANGNRTQDLYDAAGRLTATTDALGHTTTTAYDAAGRATAVTDPLGHTTTTAYDAASRPTAGVDALGHTTTTAYDPAGNVTALTDADGNRTQFLFDADNRQTAAVDPLGNRTTTTYDAASRVSTTTDADGREQVFHYDNADRLTATTWLSSAGVTVNLLTYTYDNNGNELTAADYSGTYTNSYDAQNRLTAQTDPLGQTLTYAYDAASNVTLRTDSLGGVLTYVYDNANRLTSEQFGGTGQTPLRADFGYDNADELTSLTRYSDLAGSTVVATTAYGYDASMRVTSITNENASAATLSYYDYTYDNADRVSTEAWKSTTATGTLSGTNTYSYDAASQLLSDGTKTYSYDATGNRNMSGYQTGTDNRTTTDGTWTYTYDNAGDMIEKSKGAGLETWYYTYDTLNRLTTVEQTANGTTATLETTATYSYDVYNNLLEVQEWQSGGATTATKYAYDGTNEWAELNGSGSLNVRDLYGPGGVLARTVAAGLANAGVNWYLADRLGSTVDIIGATSAAYVLNHSNYDGYGNETDTSATVADHHGYASYFSDGIIHLDLAGVRVYSPATGEWQELDPEGFAAGQANLSEYVANDPTNATDPSGLYAQYWWQDLGET